MAKNNIVYIVSEVWDDRIGFDDAKFTVFDNQEAAQAYVTHVKERDGNDKHLRLEAAPVYTTFKRNLM